MEDSEAADRAKYRDTLVQGRDDAQGSFDKAIMSLSGGALGIALGFVRTSGPPQLAAALWLAWACFIGSLLSTLLSFVTSGKSYDKALAQLSDNLDPDRIYGEAVGGKASMQTQRLNLWALALFMAGLGLMALFVGTNLDKLR